MGRCPGLLRPWGERASAIEKNARQPTSRASESYVVFSGGHAFSGHTMVNPTA